MARPSAWLTAEQREDSLLRGLEDVLPDLTAVEKSLVAAAARDRMFKADSAEHRPEVRSAVVDWLLSTPAAVELLPRHRLGLRHLTVTGGIDLSEAQTDATIVLDDVIVLGAIALRDARLGSVSITDSEIGLQADRVALDLTRCELRGPLLMERSQCRGLQMNDARIGGQLSCRGSTFSNPDGRALSGDRARIGGGAFLDEGAQFEGEVALPGVTIGGQLSCSWSTFRNRDGTALAVDRAQISGDLFLGQQTQFDGEVRLVFVTVGGVLASVGSTFSNPNADALVADGARIDGGVYLVAGTRFEGGVGLSGVTIGGQLSCRGSTFSNLDRIAFNADRAQISGDLIADDEALFEGEMRLLGATIGGYLSCERSTFVNGHEKALAADRAQIRGGAFLDEARFEGEVRLPGAAVGGALVCTRSTFSNRDGDALNADGAQISGDVLVDEEARFEGEVRLFGAVINGQLSGSGSTFSNPNGTAISAGGTEISGSVYLEEARFEGSVRLPDATIGPLSCKGSTFTDVAGDALTADGTQIRGSVFLNEAARFDGGVRLRGVTIAGELNCSGSAFTAPNGIALSVSGARIAQEAVLMPAAYSGTVELKGASLRGGLWLPQGEGDASFVFDLADAEVSTIHLGDTSARLNLTGTAYRRIQPLPEASERSIVNRLLAQWDPPAPVPATTYENLAAALRGAGEEPLARDVMVRRHDRRPRQARDGRRGAPTRFAFFLFKKTMRYGYSPFRPLAIALAAAVLGTTIMLVATYTGVVVSPHHTWRILGSTITGVGALIRLDTLFLEPTRAALHHTSTWQRIVYNITWGCYWLESILGWVLAAIFVAGLANIVRRV